MMQSLLADRFKLAIHHETRQLPIMALVLDKPGKLGPQLQEHPEDSPCAITPSAQNSTPGKDDDRRRFSSALWSTRKFATNRARSRTSRRA